MAIRSCSDVTNSEKRNRLLVSSKRITPFSIDDILSGSNLSDVATADDKAAVTSSNGFVSKTKWRPLKCDRFPLMMRGNEEAQILWLEHLQSLCSYSAFHPYWSPHLRPDVAFFNSCRKLFYPGTDQLLDCPRNFKDVPSEEVKRSRRRSLGSRAADSPAASENWFKKRAESISKRKREGSSGSQGTTSGNCTSDSEDSYPRDPMESNQSDSDSPLTALERLTCSTFKGMEKMPHQLHAVANERNATKTKRRKCRTAFTSFQLSLLEQRFNCHKYLTPTDRDNIAHVLGLSASQVITWFQNRRAKQKRELEEMRNDIKTVETSVKKYNVKWPSLESALARAERLNFQRDSKR